MASVDKETVEKALKAVQLRKARYALFRVNNTAEKMEIVLDKQSERKCNYKDFLADLRDDTPRYCVYDYEFKSADGRPTSALYFFYFVPENVNQNDRILYSTGKSNFVHM